MIVHAARPPPPKHCPRDRASPPPLLVPALALALVVCHRHPHVAIETVSFELMNDCIASANARAQDLVKLLDAALATPA